MFAWIGRYFCRPIWTKKSPKRCFHKECGTRRPDRTACCRDDLVPAQATAMLLVLSITPHVLWIKSWYNILMYAKCTVGHMSILFCSELRSPSLNISESRFDVSHGPRFMFFSPWRLWGGTLARRLIRRRIGGNVEPRESTYGQVLVSRRKKLFYFESCRRICRHLGQLFRR